VDVLDIHYYPQASGVALSDDESAATSALRLRSTRSLFDPTYVDESWIGEAVRLVPRMRELIDAHCPGLGLAITEYSWGNDDGLSSALAQVDVLGIFGREGVDMATRWVAPATGTRVEDAFRVFLDYDGAGSRVAGDSVRATSSEPRSVTAHGVRAPDDRLFVVLVNADTRDRDVDVDAGAPIETGIQLFGFDAGTRLAALGSVMASGSGFMLAMPARSARLAVARVTCARPGAVSELRVGRSGDGSQLAMSWTDAAGAIEHVVREDVAPGGPFLEEAATVASRGASLPIGTGDRYFLVSGRNACGEGDLR
jgi:hypothetical protein